MIDKLRVVRESLQGASKGGAIAAAGSILSGAAMISVPVKILGIITIGSATVVSIPVVAGVAVGGALAAGTAAGVASYFRQRRVEDEFNRLSQGTDKVTGAK